MHNRDRLENLTANSPDLKKTGNWPLIVGIFLFFFIVALGFFFAGKVLLCRNLYGRPFPTGITSEIYELGEEGFKTWQTTACVVNMRSVSEGEAFLKVGFFDKFWRMHTYNARLGGKSPSVGVCTKTGTCELKNPGEFIGNLKKGSVIELFFVTRNDGFELLDSSEQGEAYWSFIGKLKEALLKKSGFPKSIQFIQVSQLKF
jgi:hypothetical protein